MKETKHRYETKCIRTTGGLGNILKLDLCASEKATFLHGDSHTVNSDIESLESDFEMFDMYDEQGMRLVKVAGLQEA